MKHRRKIPFCGPILEAIPTKEARVALGWRQFLYWFADAEHRLNPRPYQRKTLCGPQMPIGQESKIQSRDYTWRNGKTTVIGCGSGCALSWSSHISLRLVIFFSTAKCRYTLGYMPLGCLSGGEIPCWRKLGSERIPFHGSARSMMTFFQTLP